jgi:signal transduction histidine kinase
METKGSKNMTDLEGLRDLYKSIPFARGPLKFLIDLYLKAYSKLLRDQDAVDPVKSFQVHLLLTVCLMTGVLMWSYSFVSYFYIKNDLIKYVSFFYVFVHHFSLVVYRRRGNIILATYCMLIAGGIFQTHFALQTGGFFSTTIIWLGILPLIAGILTNKTHTFLWSALVGTTIILVFIVDVGYGLFPNNMEESGRLVTQFLNAYGMIFLNGFFTLFLLQLARVNADSLRSRVLSKQNLLHVLAHDIANPISVVSNNVHFLSRYLIKKGFTDEKVEKRLEHCTTGIQNSIDIISSVRDIEAFEVGKKNLTLRPVDLRNCLFNVVKMLKCRIESKRIKITTEFLDTRKVLGIATVIEQQVFANVLTNAIKFSDQNSEIKVTISSFDDEFIRVSFRDYGVGIPPYILNNLFDPLSSTNRTGTGGEVGTGFGMPIAFKTMNILEGRILVESFEKEVRPDDHGTDFQLFFKYGTSQIVKQSIVV